MEAFSQKLNAHFESWLGPRGEFGSPFLIVVFFSCERQPRNFHRLLLDVQRAVCLRLTAANISEH